MKELGIEEMEYEKDLVRKIMNEGVKDEEEMENKMKEKR